MNGFFAKPPARVFRSLRAIGLIVTSCFAVGLSGCAKQTVEATVSRDLETIVSVQRPEYVQTFSDRRSYTGELQARRTSNLSFRQGGILQTVYADEGGRIKAGFELASLDVEPLLAERGTLLAQREEAQARLDELEAGPRKEVIGAAQALVRQLDADWQLVARKEQRTRKLVKSSAASQDEHETQSFGVDVARERLSAARFQLEELKAGTRKELLRAQSAVVSRIVAQLNKIDLDIRDSKLKAPFDGVLTRRWTDEGEVMSAGQPVFTIIEIGEIEARIRVPASLADDLSSDRNYTVHVGSAKFGAKLQSIIPQVDVATRTVEAVFVIQENDPRLYPGRMAELLFDREVDVHGFWLPTAALVADVRGMWACYSLRSDPQASAGAYQVERQLVEILHVEADRVLVKGTLTADAVIIVEGVHRVVPGQLVRPKTKR